MNRAERGRIGEDTCIWYLEKHGYAVLDRNVHSRYGEIDVIAENDTFLCFVEVKTRAADAVVSPVEAVDYKKLYGRIVNTIPHKAVTILESYLVAKFFPTLNHLL